jgi:photosystem II stability/assembly factor-like uncharacterized protein
MEAGAERARSAAAWVAVALLLVAVVGVVYLRPNLAGPPSAASRSRPPAAASLGLALGNVSFADERHGSVTIFRLAAQFPGDQVSYVTSDGGATWRRGAHLNYLTPRLVIQQSDGSPGVYRISADGGRTWHKMAMPEPPALVTGPPTFIDPTHGWWLLRQLRSPTAGATLWRTDDGGATWLSLPGTGVPQGDVLSQARFVDPLRGVLEAGPASGPLSLFVTSDGGLTWRAALTLDSPLTGLPAVSAALFSRGGTLLAWLTARVAGAFVAGSTTATYVLVSGDGGLTWSAPRAGPELLAAAISAPAVDDRGRLLVLEGRRLWISEDEGLTWTARVVQAPAGLQPFGPIVAGRALLAPAASGRTIGSTRFVDTLLRSTDGGAHWDVVRLP